MLDIQCYSIAETANVKIMGIITDQPLNYCDCQKLGILCLAGIQCTTIEGYSKGYNYDVGKTFTGEDDHAWNAVFLDGKWHLLDSNDLGTRDPKSHPQHVPTSLGQITLDAHIGVVFIAHSGLVNCGYVEFYFFTHPTLFINNHFPNDEKWQLISPKISLKIFENMVFRTGEFYDIGLTYIHPEVQVVSTDAARPDKLFQQLLFLFLVSLPLFSLSKI
eukprot:g39838.t1